MKHPLPSEWRTNSRWKRWFYSRYMRWLERLGYGLLVGVVGALGYAFTYEVDESIIADGVEFKLDKATGAVTVEAELKGESAPSAQVGQTAKLVNITLEPLSGTLLRASSGKTEWISGTALGGAVKDAIEKGLSGQTVETRYDSDLKIKSVVDVAVDAKVRTSADQGSVGFYLEPSATDAIQGKVTSGEHLATVQISNLPADVQEKAKAAVRDAIVGKSGEAASGGSGAISDLDSVHFVVKVSAEPASGGGSALAGASVSRSFNAKIDVPNPPAYLVEALRAGRKATCRVELATRRKPIALTLLKKS